MLTQCSRMASSISTKAAIRKAVKKKLSLLTKEESQRQSENVAKKLFSLPSFQQSKRISTYLSIPGEINTILIVRKILEDKKECFVPRYNKQIMEMVKIHSMEDWETLPMTNWGIKQPRMEEKRENALDTGGLDFIVVPGVAFTRSGLRCGHGGGYYDKYIVDIRSMQSKPPTLVGLALKQQIFEDLPVSDTDVPVDLVLFSD